MTEIQQQVMSWLANGETGLSSECMAFWLAFGILKDRGFGADHPHDPDDMNRCLKLLQRVPGLRESLPAMAELSPAWKALVSRWDEIEAMQMAEIGIDWEKGRKARRTYALIQEVLNSAGVPF